MAKTIDVTYSLGGNTLTLYLDDGRQIELTNLEAGEWCYARLNKRVIEDLYELIGLEEPDARCA